MTLTLPYVAASFVTAIVCVAINRGVDGGLMASPIREVPVMVEGPTAFAQAISVVHVGGSDKPHLVQRSEELAHNRTRGELDAR